MEHQAIFSRTREAAKKLSLLPSGTIDQVLRDVADELIRSTPVILRENLRDLARMAETDPRYDRLKLTPERIRGIANDVENVISLPTPVGRMLLEKTLPNGLQLSKVAVPIGVIGMIYEARPNVTCDAFVLCFKTGNACILKGGSDAAFSNAAIIDIIKPILNKHGVDIDSVYLMPPDRSSTETLLQAVGWVDVVIPRGSSQLINYVRSHARVPVIETGAGIVHTYFDDTADPEKGADIVFNAKTRRVSVCNALDCLIVHEERLDVLAQLVKPLESSKVEIYADEPAYRALSGVYAGDLLFSAKEEHYGTEFLSYKMAIKTVSNLTEALDHISRYGSKHSEAIVSEDPEHIGEFLRTVDAAAVYVNASTAFTDGAEFGLGAEIGISTQKLHARGPMGLEALTSYKWLVTGSGQVRKG